MAERLYSYGKNRTNSFGLAERLKAREEWRMGKMRAEFNPDIISYGQLPNDYGYRNGLGWADYVVYSYDTPIAWHVTYGGEQYWVQPDVKYFRTTTRHQNRVATAISVMDKV